MPRLDDLAPADIARAALTRGRHPVAKLISLVEDQRTDAAERRDEALSVLEDAAAERGHHGCIIGLTGTPGSGKSSLLARVANQMLATDLQLTVAMVAVDRAARPGWSACWVIGPG